MVCKHDSVPSSCDSQFPITVMSNESMSECTLVFRIQRYDMHVVFNHYCALNILVASFWLYVYNMMLLSMCQS